MSVTNEMQYKNHFDPITHKPPKFDIFGRLKKASFNPKYTEQKNVLAQKEEIKLPWIKGEYTPEPMTRTKLLEKRKLEKVPDITYDLDNDGYVGSRDYVLAKRFDKDNDGKLNEKEKREAYESLKNNIEDNYVWNLDNQGPNRAYRILQKRGQIIDAEDFLPIQETYPKHPLSSKIPTSQTLTELKSKRIQQTKAEIGNKIKKYEEENPTVFINEPIKYHNTGRKNPSINEIKAEKHRQARIACGLKEYEEETRPIHKIPTLEYVYSPKHKTAKDIKDEINRENKEKIEKFKNNNEIYKDEIMRMNEREDEIFAQLYSNEPRYTLNVLKEKRRKENLEYNLKTFSKQTIGVHGHELPKFSENNDYKEYWKHKDGYIENPDINSMTYLHEKKKYWKKMEELLLNEHQDEILEPIDKDRKRVYKKEEKDLIIKINKLNHFKDYDPDNPKPIDIEEGHRNHIYKWSTLVHQFAPHKFKKGRLFDSIIPDENMEGSNSYNNVDVESQFGKGIFSKKKDDKYMKINENLKVNQENNNNNKENLYQKFSNKDQNKNAEKPKHLNIRTKAF